MVQAKHLFKIKNASQKIVTNFFLFQRCSCHFQYAFDDNLSVTHVFIKQIFRAVELSPPFHLPLHRAVQGWGSSDSFQPQAVALVMAMKQ
jgi:hypothetical protein